MDNIKWPALQLRSNNAIFHYRMDCVFCKIAKGEVPADKIYEDEDTLAFLNIRPNSLGHSLVIPKKHFENIYSTPNDVLSKLIATVKKVAIGIKKAMNADGINIGNNSDPAAGQVVFHTHIHIIPRFLNDGFHHWDGKEVSEEEQREAAEKIREALK